MNSEVMAMITGVVMAVVGWFSSKAMTKREKKKSDMELISSSTENLLAGINQLTSQNKALVDELKIQQEKNLQLIKENNELLLDKQTLSNEIKKLRKEVEQLRKIVTQNIENEKKDTDNN